MEVIVESATPINQKLCAKFSKSFAYKTVTERLPVIVTSIIDTLSRDKHHLRDDMKEETKAIIGELSELKYTMQTGKPLVHLTSDQPDTLMYNNSIKEYSQQINSELTFYDGPWLFVECYMYRKINEIFLLSKSLKDYDMFLEKKEAVLDKALSFMEPVFQRLVDKNILSNEPLVTSSIIEQFESLVKLTLWANKVDLSMSGGSTEHGKHTDMDIMDTSRWNNYLLSDDIGKLTINLIYSNTDSSRTVDYVLDNCGLELLCDLCFADFLVTRCGVNKIRLRAKRIPWFVSDVTPRDFTHTLNRCANQSSSAPAKALAQRWNHYIKTGVWEVHSDVYWTLALPYSEMPRVDPRLYSELCQSSLIIFKGDLNYRKLIQDTNWESGTPLSQALGNFKPAPLVAIRIMKADTVAGIDKELCELTASQQPDWLVSGDYGLIQFHSNKVT